MIPSPSELKIWRADHASHIDRAAVDLEEATRRFLEDWVIANDVRVVSVSSARIKSVQRVWSKLRRKVQRGDVTDVDTQTLLSSSSPVGDLVGLRVVVRGLKDLVNFERIARENDFLATGIYDLIEIENKFSDSTPTGYRALHINSTVTVAVRGEEARVPVEVQIKTDLQDAWGTFTHDIAYSQVDLHEDVKFSRLRELQRVLADSLHVADQLNVAVEDIYSDFASSRPTQPGALLDVEGVLAAWSENFVDEGLPLVDAQRVLDMAEFCGLRTVDELRAVLADQDKLNATATAIAERGGVDPSPLDIVIALIENHSH